MAKIIFENDLIRVSKTGHDYDFIVTVKNKSDREICIHYNEPNFSDNYDPIILKPEEWIGLLANDEGYDWMTAFEKGKFRIMQELDDSDKIIFKDDLEDVQNEVERILSEYHIDEKEHNEQVYVSNQIITVLEILKSIK